MRPLTSWICANAALPITRLASRRPATATRRPVPSSASALQASASAYSAWRSPAWSSRRKSFGKAMPCPRSAASFPRRSAIRLFSSAVGGWGCAGVVMLVSESGPGGRNGRWKGGRCRGRAACPPWPGPWAPSSDGVHAFGADLEAGLQARFDELVEVAVEHVLGVGALDAGAQVLDPALVEHVVADLAAPADVGLGGLHRVALGVALLHFQFVQLGRQHLHRGVAVGVLAAAGLAGHHDAGGHVGDAHRRLGLVDVL